MTHPHLRICIEFTLWQIHSLRWSGVSHRLSKLDVGRQNCAQTNPINKVPSKHTHTTGIYSANDGCAWWSLESHSLCENDVPNQQWGCVHTHKKMTQTNTRGNTFLHNGSEYMSIWFVFGVELLWQKRCGKLIWYVFSTENVEVSVARTSVWANVFKCLHQGTRSAVVAHYTLCRHRIDHIRDLSVFRRNLVLSALGRE